VISGAPAAENQRWKDMVDPSLVLKTPHNEQQRQEVIYELLRTEKEYLRDLNVIIEVFFSP